MVFVAPVVVSLPDPRARTIYDQMHLLCVTLDIVASTCMCICQILNLWPDNEP